MKKTVDESTLNLGCGEDKRADAWNVDISEAVDPDEQVNLQSTPWPWADGQFEMIVARHVLEHLDPVPFGELERVLTDGGRLYVTYPIGHTRFEDPTHKQYWNWNSAAALAGERDHAHEHETGLRLVGQSLDWDASNRLARVFTRLKLLVDGPGPWLGQVPGLYGEVEAVFVR